MSDTGPRPKDALRTREHILAAARREFAQHGFSGATVRTIAGAAGVSPNLITRYFGGKERLFVAATDIRLGLDHILDGPRASLGRRLGNAIVVRWTTMTGEDPLLALLRAAGGRPEAAETSATFLDRESYEPLRHRLLAYGLSEQEADTRARAIDVFVLGISARCRMLRQDLGDPASLGEWIASTIQRLVDDP